MTSTSAIGTAGELRVASELLLRGFRPRLALLDEGIDIQLEDGTTIQVKSAQNAPSCNRSEQYTFNFQSRPYDSPKLVADFVVLWCVPDKFYVVPKEEMLRRRTVTIYALSAKRACKWRRYHNNWEALRAARVSPREGDL